MLAYCDAVDSMEKGRATRDLAAQKLGHINTLMVTQVYAPQVPSHIPNPLNYFGISGVKFGEFWVTRFSTLWDAFLLKKFLEYYRVIMSESEFGKLKQIIEKEARDYQSMVGHETESHILMGVIYRRQYHRIHSVEQIEFEQETSKKKKKRALNSISIQLINTLMISVYYFLTEVTLSPSIQRVNSKDSNRAR